MSDLYNHNKVKAHVSFTKGEGFGRPLIEAAITGKPIIASNWSGHVDFLNTETSVLLPGTLTKVHKSAAWKGVLNEDSEWFSVDLNVAAGFLKDVFKNYKSYTEKSRKTYHHIKTNFSFDAMKDKLGVILDSRIPEFPKMLGLNLPKLKKVESMPQITLPKLKKVDA
jgi:glycosyltransferase involved in cell wall biosynthesis